MHKSKLAGFIIDCKTDDLAGAATFWSAALGYKTRQLPGREGEHYVALDDPGEQLHVEVQSVSHPSRVHLDIETDDIAAEVARLEAQGARRVSDIESWVVMEAPTGQRFCIVPASSKHFDQTAHSWP